MPKKGPRLDGPIPVDTKARDAFIIGRPPRIPPLTELGPEAKDAVVRFRNAVGLPQIEHVPEFVGTLLRYPKIFGPHTELSLHFYSGALPVRDRELALLRQAWLDQAPFEWGEHVAISKRLGGVTAEEIERVILGSSAPGWSEHDRAVLRATEELLEDAMISDETWALLAQAWNEQQLIEFPLMMGQYRGLAYLQNSLRLRLIDPNPGLSAR